MEADRLCRERRAEGQGVRAHAGRSGGQARGAGSGEFNLYQVSVADLAKRTGLRFGSLTEADTLAASPEAVGEAGVRRIDSRSEIVTE